MSIYTLTSLKSRWMLFPNKIEVLKYYFHEWWRLTSSGSQIKPAAISGKVLWDFTGKNEFWSTTLSFLF